MLNYKINFKSLAFAILLIGLLPNWVSAQQSDTKTVDKFNELNQLLPKDQKSTFSGSPLSNGNLKRVPMRVNGKDTILNFPEIPMPDGTVFVPAAKVRINGKDSFINMPMFTTGDAKTLAALANKQSRGAAISYSHSDKMPTVKPDMSKYRMPNMAATYSKTVTSPLSFDKPNSTAKAAYNILPAPANMVKKLTGADVADLSIGDVGLTPQSSTGETLLTFLLPAVAPAEVALTDSEGKQIWTSKTRTPRFSKSFNTPAGTYYLVVKQGDKAAVRMLLKE